MTIHEPSGAIAAGPSGPSLALANTDGAEPSIGTRVADAAVLTTTAEPFGRNSRRAIGPSAVNGTPTACPLVRSQTVTVFDELTGDRKQSSVRAQRRAC